MMLTTTEGRLEERSRVAMSHLRFILEWVGFVGFMGFVLVGIILACVFYPLILCAQWGQRHVSRVFDAMHAARHA